MQAKEEGAAQTDASRQEQKKEAASGAALHLHPPSSHPPTSGSLPLLQKADGETPSDSHAALLRSFTQVGALFLNLIWESPTAVSAASAPLFQVQ